MQCCFDSCKRRVIRRQINLHEFPKGEDMRSKWVCVVRSARREPRWTPDSQTRVCSLHFSKEQFLSNRVLHPRAVPSAKCDAFRRVRASNVPRGMAGAGAGSQSPAASAYIDLTEPFQTAEEKARAAEDEAAAAAPDPPAGPDSESEAELDEPEADTETEQELELENELLAIFEPDKVKSGVVNSETKIECELRAEPAAAGASAGASADAAAEPGISSELEKVAQAIAENTE